MLRPVKQAPHQWGRGSGGQHDRGAAPADGEDLWAWGGEESAFEARPLIEQTVARINEARERHGEAILDAREASQVAANLERRAADPRRYRNVCWKCTAVVDQGTNERCPECKWFICWCGACRKRDFKDWNGVVGACRREVWTLQDEAPPDVDFRGRKITTARPLTEEAETIRAVTREHGVGSLFHWSPPRAIPTILKLGLLAREDLRDRGISFVPHGYGSPEKEAALSRYVATSFRPKGQMMRAWSDHPVVWELDPEVMLAAGTLFVDGNSASSSRSVDRILSLTGSSAYRQALVARDAPGGQPEILIPGRVPRAGIVRIHIADPSVARSARSTVGAMHAPMWEVCSDHACDIEGQI